MTVSAGPADLLARVDPGGSAPQRTYSVDAAGVRLAVYEWGDPHAQPVLLCHGTMEFARTFDGLAPRLAARGYRVVSWDHRGHGDSSWTQLYSWSADLRDAVIVLNRVAGKSPALLGGHSKGGALMTALASAAPTRVRAVVNVEGFQPAETVALRDSMGEWVRDWLDRRLRLGADDGRGRTVADLAERRARGNPRVDPALIRYLAEIGSEQVAGGWRWKVDPAIRLGSYWPRRPDWSPSTVRGLTCRFLAVVGRTLEPVARGATPEDVAAQLPLGGRMYVANTGHFVHFEQPDELARVIGDFLAEPDPAQA